jgi:hypothetical protein
MKILELQENASGPQRTGELAILEKAVLSPLISESTVDELKQVLRLVMIKAGLRSQNWPQDEEKVVLIDHIVSNFGGNRIEEIKLAFDLAIAEKLEIEKKEISCYENFSCAYFSKIMNAYRLWSTQEIKHIKTEEPPVQKIFTQDELDDSAREDAERQYQLFLKGIEPIHTDINRPILKKDNLIHEGESVRDFFKRMAGKERLNIYTR